MQTPKVLLIDGSGYIFRAYHAVDPNLKTKAGFPTNALFGFTRMLLKLLRASETDYIVVAFDHGKDTFRTQLYPQYKANRDACPEDLLQQMPYFREITRALGLQVVDQENFEADDLIGTLCQRLLQEACAVEIISGDKDLMQLVSEQVTVYDSMRDRRYGPEQVKEKLGVYPEQVINFLSLTGDSSDNVPGIRGVGPKTAVQLLEIFGSAENIAQSAAVIALDPRIRSRAKISEAIAASAEMMPLSKELVTIKCDCPVLLNTGQGAQELSTLNKQQLLAALQKDPEQPEELKRLATALEFKGMFNDVLAKAAREKTPNSNYEIISSANFSTWLTELQKQTEFAFDLETTSLDPQQAEIVGISFCWNSERAAYLPLQHKENSILQMPVALALESLAVIFKNKNIKKIGQNLKYDYSVLAEQGIELQGVAFDTMIASYCLNPDKVSHSLSALAEEYLGQTMLSYQDLLGKLADFSEVPIAAACEYSCADAHYTWLIYQRLKVELKTYDLEELFYDLEMPLVAVLAQMELAGIGLDVDFLKGMSVELEIKLKDLEQQIYNTAGVEFNINSPKQLSDVLFNQLQISSKGLKRTKTGTSTDSSVLEKLAGQHPLADLLLSYRMLHKLKSTYVDALPQLVSKKTGRLHTRFNQTGTGTGRLSSSDPNLQNIPVQSSEGRRIRKAFIPAAGSILVAADYSQIELRILAHLSNDRELIQAFEYNEDIHSKTAREILNLPPLLEVTSEQRRIGKTINFGIIYGMGAQRLSRELALPYPIAAKYIDNYFDLYAGVRTYFEKIEQEANDLGIVKTITGRRRLVSELEVNSRDPGRLKRIAINAPVQGSAADIIKMAMLRVQQEIVEKSLPMKLLLQIHDELLLECPADFADQALSQVKNIMENIIELKVPLIVEAATGLNWEEIT